MEPVAVLVATGAVVAALLMMLAVWRGLRVRYQMQRRAQRFLDFGPADAPEGPGPADARKVLTAQLAVLVAAYRTIWTIGLVAIGLLIFGGLLNRALGVVMAALVVGVAVWRQLRRSGQRREQLAVQLVPRCG
jgi:hypothetical protein